MKIPQLQINQAFGQISIRQDHGGVKIQQPKAKVNITTENPRVEIERSEGELTIDQSKAWAAYGLINPVELTRSIADQARSMAYQAMAKKAQDGDRMAAIHQSTDVIAELAQEKFSQTHELRVAKAASYDNVDIFYTPDQLTFRPMKGSVNVQVQPQKPIIERVPSQVMIGMERYPSIQISWAGQHIDQLL
jgi:hypothetical protein